MADIATKVKPIFPENVVGGTVLKLTSRENPSTHVVVEILRKANTIPPHDAYFVMVFDTGIECVLYTSQQALERDSDAPVFWFLRADIATAQEIATYIDRRRKEIGQEIAKITALQDRFEEKVGYRHKST